MGDSSIKAIVFDYGQVISFPPNPDTLSEIARRAGVEREKFEPLLWSSRSEYDRGLVSVREYYKKVLLHLGVSLDDGSIDELTVMDLESWKNINPGTVALMEEVKQRGYILGILSNMPHDFLSWARENVPVFSLPHISIFSCELGLVKPEEAIYRKLLSLAGVKSEELVFFDDKTENVISARAVGIKAFIWSNPDQARRELSSLGVTL